MRFMGRFIFKFIIGLWKMVRIKIFLFLGVMWIVMNDVLVFGVWFIGLK